MFISHLTLYVVEMTSLYNKRIFDKWWCNCTHFLSSAPPGREWSALTAQTLYTQGQSPRCPLNRKLSGSLSQCGDLQEERALPSLKGSITGSVIHPAGTSFVPHRVLNRCVCFCVVEQKSRIVLHCAEGTLQVQGCCLFLCRSAYRAKGVSQKLEVTVILV
jgi:hypothetical protein